MNRIIILFSLFFLYLSLNAQDKVTGVIYDKDTQEVLPYASIHIANTNQGTITDEHGQFELQLEENVNDLIISYLGYQELNYTLEEKTMAISIYLEPWEYNLSEVVVRPKSALEYIKEAISLYSSNLSQQPFSTQAYFSDSNIISQDSKSNIKKEEVVLKTYFSNFADTTNTSTNRLLLYEYSDNGVEVELKKVMDKNKVSKKVSKIEEKEEKRQEGKETEEDSEIPNDGPVFVLSLFHKLVNLPFLKEENFDRIEFDFGETSYYEGKELISITFKNKSPINLMSRYNGQIFLDKDNLAIVSIIYDELIKVPAILRPLVKMKLGVNVLSMDDKVQISNQLINGYWYPQKMIHESKVNIKKTKVFKESNHLGISKKYVFIVEDIELENPQRISPHLQYNINIPYEDQIHPIEGLEWEDIHIIR